MIKTQPKGVVSVILSNGVHQIVSDVSEKGGGQDEGLSPHELVEAALAGCTTMTLELYAKRKGWLLIDLKVEVKIIQEGETSILERNISFGTMPEENKKRLLEIANKCPIHKLLVSKIEIKTYEKENLA